MAPYRAMERGRVCDACGGVVDVIVVSKERPDGTALPAKVGACRSCGSSFNEAGLMNLDAAERRDLTTRRKPTTASRT
jgi:hypothetical protein